MQPLTSRPNRALHVTVVSGNPDTMDGLETYLRAAGMTTNGTRYIEKSSEMTPPASDAVVLFPDDFRSDAVISALASLRIERPSALVVLITKDPKRFERLPLTDDQLAPLVVPKPVWGWTILEAIRARLESVGEEHARR